MSNKKTKVMDTPSNRHDVMKFIDLVKEALVAFSSMPMILNSSVQQWNAAEGDYKLRVDTLDLEPGSIVFDVGAYKGDWSNRMFNKFPGIKVVAFEPVEHYCDEFSKLNEGRDYDMFRVGLSNKEQRLFIEDTGLSTSLSSEGNLAIDVKDIRSYVSLYESIDVLKMNIEGAEYECIEALIESDMIRKVRHVLVQFHGVDNNVETSVAKWAAIAENLSKTHNLDWSYPFIWERWTLRDS